MTRALVLAACAACGRIDFAELDEPWGTPTQVFAPSGDDNPTLTSDMLELYFVRNGNIQRASRASVTDAWGAPAVVPELSSPAGETIPEISGDGLTIYFLSARLGGGILRIFTATRALRTDVWSGITEVVELESGAHDGAPVVADDGLSLVMPSDRGGNNDIYTSTRATKASTWDVPVLLAGVNGPAYDSDPFMMNDGLTIYIRSDRQGAADLFVATRTSVTDAFATPMPIDELDTPFSDSDPWVSPDQRTIYFESDRTGVGGLYMATR